MKKTITNIIITVVAIIILIVALKYLLVDPQIEKYISRIERTQSRVDSLQRENKQLIARIDSLDEAYQESKAKIEDLKKDIVAKNLKYQKTIRRIYEFKGSNDSLHNALNDAIRREFAARPD